MAQDVVARLEDAGVRLDRALTEADVARVEKRYGFRFGPDHRALLRTALPLGDAWLNWRHATPANIRTRLQAPVDGLLEQVRQGFWPATWGPRPDGEGAAQDAARRHLDGVPVLVPLYGRHYLPAAPEPAGSPVFSVHGRDVAVLATDLRHYVDVAFGPSGSGPGESGSSGSGASGSGASGSGPSGSGASGSAGGDRPEPVRVAFWSDLAGTG